MNHQHTIDHHQALYRQWLTLQDDRETFIDKLAHQAVVGDELFAFYFGRGDGDTQSDWRQYYDLIDEGQIDVDLTTQGEYSVMSEDTLWNAFCDEREFYERLLALAQKRLTQLDER